MPNKIITGYDGSEGGKAALGEAIKLANDVGGDVTVVFAYEKVVVGETATIGDDVTIYQGVTLGGTGKERGKRHPDIGNNVIIGVGAKVLGAITIGEGAKIGGGSVVLKDVPAHTTAVGNPARSVAWTDPQSGRTQRRESLPDPLQDTVRALSERIEELEQRLRELERAPNDNAVRSDRLA